MKTRHMFFFFISFALIVLFIYHIEDTFTLVVKERALCFTKLSEALGGRTSVLQLHQKPQILV